VDSGWRWFVQASVPKAGREVALSEVIEQGHEPASTFAAGDALESGHVGAGQLAHEEASAGEANAYRVGLAGGDGDTLVDQDLIEDGRHDVLGAADGFGAFDAGDDAAAVAWVPGATNDPACWPPRGRYHAVSAASPAPALKLFCNFRSSGGGRRGSR